VKELKHDRDASLDRLLSVTLKAREGAAPAGPCLDAETVAAWADAALDANERAIAEAHGISKRYLHYLFAHTHSTFGDELMKMRLDCAIRLLGDARFVELAPGRTLAGLAKRINRRLPIESLATAEALS